MLYLDFRIIVQIGLNKPIDILLDKISFILGAKSAKIRKR